MQIPKEGERVFKMKNARYINDCLWRYRQILAKETGNSYFLKVHFHTLRHYAISWQYFKTRDIVETQRFARHCNIQNTLRYVHIVKSWIKENEYDVVYAKDKTELTIIEGTEETSSSVLVSVQAPEQPTWGIHHHSNSYYHNSGSTSNSDVRQKIKR